MPSPKLVKRQWSVVILLMTTIFILLSLLYLNKQFEIGQNRANQISAVNKRITDNNNETGRFPRLSNPSSSNASQSSHLSLPTNESKLETFLLVIVLTSHKNKDRRDAIRETWKNSYVQQGKQFVVMFGVGVLQLKDAEKEAVYAENKEHNDLLILEDHWDSYMNLTRKVLQMFIWADRNVQYSYLLKTDDDCFVRLDFIEAELKARKSTKELCWGHIANNQHPKTKGKWKEDKWFLCTTYFPYALGGGYVLSASLVHRIVYNADGLLLYNSEDVSVGAWISPFDVERKNDHRFAVNPPTKHKCSNEYIVKHSTSPADMKKKHNSMASKGVLCDKET